ncbi:hypothetical protein MGYG_02899 [Nannizzia gypsea CBS 118893]|uniref:Uncharacterized protein n=1 Tax=Arthroderma gypseum (strain ATCC MYA-4604 / CBS 118893) TaxID=535722 RepID=E4UPL2_ARTGP|nr:hypothetical protein MGYG_02899 [Nannizzia gypsea CBS 118893]EFQ99887.1 hypothetical protein MGYG_02899 [Nannizzia gypsea CBS 118893]
MPDSLPSCEKDNPTVVFCIKLATLAHFMHIPRTSLYHTVTSKSENNQLCKSLCQSLKSEYMRTLEDIGCKQCARLRLDYVYSVPLPLGRPRGNKRGSSSSDTVLLEVFSSSIASSEASLGLVRSLSQVYRIYGMITGCYVPSSQYYAGQGNSSLNMGILANDRPSGMESAQKTVTDGLR